MRGQSGSGRLEPGQDFVLRSFNFVQMVVQSHGRVFGRRAMRFIWCFEKENFSGSEVENGIETEVRL